MKRRAAQICWWRLGPQRRPGREVSSHELSIRASWRGWRGGGTAVNRDILARYLPLIGHVIPTLAIGYGIVIPRSCFAGWNESTIGFGASVMGTCVAYVLGQRVASRRPGRSCGRASS